ncbi:hypothetical protein [Mycolicibacterium komossense]|uniref:hypothetical protein n=1 Tax=Mycolicibacterium komossense TaxID=1779 RepID=UPI0021F346DB|nr:hypothetical protein [Mycolicibacterium komossense]
MGDAVAARRFVDRDIPGRSTPLVATVALAGFASAGALVAVLSGSLTAPTVTVSGIQLASTETSLIPLSPDTSSTDTDFWLLSGHGSTDQAAASSADRIAAVQAASPVVGPGGWLIGDGLDAASNCTGNACNGGNGGLLGGNGGNGANGGDGLDAASNCTGNACNGGNGGLLGGNGGNGANGGNGGNAGLFFGNGGDGGDGVQATYFPNGSLATEAKAGGNGGPVLRQRRRRRRRRSGHLLPQRLAGHGGQSGRQRW